MSKKAIYITLACMLSIFAIVMTIIIVQRNKSKQDVLVTDNTGNHYYDQGVADQKDPYDGMTEEEYREHYTLHIEDAEYVNLDRLTKAQYTCKDKLVRLVNNATKDYAQEHGDIVTASIEEMSNENQVYVNITFTDNTTDIYVVTYDNYSTHNFMRAVTLDYWNSIEAGDNAG